MADKVLQNVEVWVCPNCGNYYGSTSAKDLNDQMTADIKGQPTHLRSRCPACGQTRLMHSFFVELGVKE